MIIEKDSIIDANDFLGNLQNALQGVLRISVKTQLGTGWLLTENLVVIPDYLGDEKSEYLCNPYSSTAASVVKARLVNRSGTGNRSIAALLELEQKIKNPAQLLQTENCEIGDPIIILQHPGGAPNVHLSFGKILDIKEQWLEYNADTQPGSGGGPVINMQNGKIMGMHVMSTAEGKVNRGISINAILEFLRNTSYWDMIIKYHKFADTRTTAKGINLENAPVTSWEPIHYKAAVKWNIKPAELSDVERKALMPHIINAKSPVWVLKTSDRQQILESVPVSELKKIKIENGVDQPGQRVINRILKGGPYNLEEVPVEDLPYWLQAVRWFAPIDKMLPGSADVNQVLERKRVRGRLSDLGGTDFKGRVIELDKLRKWYANENAGPLVISGIGGIGKSALISHFALGLPENTTLLWLDFDRADLAPDNAHSVLKILSEQIAIQVPEFVVPVGTSDWKKMAAMLAENFTVALAYQPSPLLVLDGFEVAQHVKQYQEIWKVLEFLIEKSPRLKIIVSGRAPVKQLKLGGKKAEPIEMKGMETADAKEFLENHGIKGKGISDKVAEMSRGIPLVLKLAIHFVDTGGKMKELIKELPQTLIEGYLYQRILDRVMDQDLKPLSKEALILRKVTPDIIREILHKNIPEGSDSEKVFESLSREMALVGENDIGSSLAVGNQAGVLQLRPEVRTATIKLLESENPAFVKDVDQRAVKYYRKQDLSNHENAAELIYHLLRTGELEEAKRYWRTECAKPLRYAVDDLNETFIAEKTWLQEKIGQVITEAGDDIVIWELDTLSQLKNLLGRGLYRGVSDILSQRTERSNNSPLILYEAWMAWITGDPQAAMEFLENSKATDPKIRKNQLILRALLEVQKNNNLKADHLLSEIITDEWSEKKFGSLENLALHAARIRLTVDIKSELDVSRKLKDEKEFYGMQSLIEKYLDDRDVVLPFITERLRKSANQESFGTGVLLPTNEAERLSFTHFQKTYFDTAAGDLQSLFEQNKEKFIVAKENSSYLDLEQKIINLSLLAAFRWKRAMLTPVLVDFAQLAIDKQEFIYPMELSIIASLAAFRGQEMAVFLESFSEPSIDVFLSRVAKNNPQTILPAVSPKRKQVLNIFLNQEFESDKRSVDIKNTIGEVQRQAELDKYNSLRFISDMKDEKTAAIILYMVGPDPLEMLCRRIIGIPDNYKVYFNTTGISQNTRLKLVDFGARVIATGIELNDLLKLACINTAMIALTGSPYTQWVTTVEYLNSSDQLAQFIVELTNKFRDNTELKQIRKDIAAGSTP